MTEDDRIAIATVRKPHGIRGGVKVTLHNINLETLQIMEQLFVKSGNEWQELHLISVHGHEADAVIHFQEVADRNEAETFRNLELWADRSRLPELEEGEFYSEDLLDCLVVDESDMPLGTVIDVLSPGSHDVLVIEGEKGEVMIPLVPEWVLDVDLNEKRIKVIAPEFME